jgi:hypothetical protein
VLRVGNGLRSWVFGQIVGQKLESDESVQSDIFSFVNHTHSAATELLDNAVMGDALPD